MKVLIAEDNPENLELLKDLLEVNGHEVLEATRGDDALVLAGMELPDIILMDIQLPDMDGYEITAILKKSDATRNIPIVALTAHAMEGDREKSLARGCDAYFSKPINTRTFVSDIEAVFEGRKA